MYKAIVIDDEDLVREAVIALGRWEDMGIDTVYEAANAREALELIKTALPDIVITDMKMPVLDGPGLLKELDSNHMNARIKVIVVSGFSDFEYTRQAILSDVVDYILKPIDSQDLNHAIAAAINEIEEEKQPADSAEEMPEDSIQNKMAFEIERFIKENYCSEITLEELAQRFYLSKEHISRTFKKQLGTNLFDYILSLRIEKSKELMLRTQYSIEEIAIKVGFSNGNYFSKAFRKYTSISPSEYRNKYLKK